MKKQTSLAIAILLFAIGQAQNINNFTYSVSTDQPTVTSTGDTVAVYSLSIAHSDSLVITAVEVQMGTFPGGSNVADYTFTVGQNFGLPNSYTINNTSGTITIGLGYHGPGIYHYRVKLYGNNGISSGHLLYNTASQQYYLQP
jgi:hypothetical protein